MDMQAYLERMDYAIKGVLQILWREYELLEIDRKEQATGSLARAEAHRQLMEKMKDGKGEDAEFRRLYDRYMGLDKENFHNLMHLDIRHETIGLIQFSVDSMAGSLLQFAKQGISIVFGDGKGLTKGRTFAGVSFRDLIFAARNQALHWEMGIRTGFEPPVERCFNALIAISPVMAEFKTRSVAFEVVRMLGWRTKADIHADLLSLK